VLLGRTGRVGARSFSSPAVPSHEGGAGVVDSSRVLWGQTLVYTLYAVAIMALIGWFAYRVTRQGPSKIPPKLFYGFVGMLVLTGVSLHLVTYNTIPWAPMDIHRAQETADRVVRLSIQDHEFRLPANPITLGCDERVLFDVSSGDLTYGFGLFRPDDSMVFQMQVVPGHRNDVLWEFGEDAVYTIRSTEYSGPEGLDMVVPDSVRVVGCAQSA
jgi:cytochrome c oxidase subunit II